VLVICYHFVLFAGIVPNREAKENIGWSCISFICLMLVLNAAVLLTVVTRTLLRKYKLWTLKRKQVKAIAARNKNAATAKSKKPVNLNPNSQLEFTSPVTQPNKPKFLLD
jgi:hypothetical protein